MLTSFASFLVLVVVASVSGASAQADLVPDNITPLELWNGATWFYPFGIAASDAWSDYLKNAQHASNLLYKQVEKALGALSLLNALTGRLPVTPPSLTTPNPAIPSVTTPSTEAGPTQSVPEVTPNPSESATSTTASNDAPSTSSPTSARETSTTSEP